LTTRTLVFEGRHLFVNADVKGGELRVEILRPDGTVAPGFSLERCVPITTDGTRLPVQWAGSPSLASVAKQPVRLRFSLTRGRLFAFWVSRWPTGESAGFPAAGGPEFGGPADVPRA
jgi:hypothetical protein